MPMPCDVARTLNQAAMDGPLPSLESTALAEHRSRCAACQAHAAALARVTAAFAAADAVVAPPDLLARLDLVAPAVTPFGRPRRAGRPWWALAGGLAAAALVVAVGLASRPGPAVIALSPSPVPAAAASLDEDAILTWMDPDADPVEVMEL